MSACTSFLFSFKNILQQKSLLLDFSWADGPCVFGRGHGVKPERDITATCWRETRVSARASRAHTVCPPCPPPCRHRTPHPAPNPSFLSLTYLLPTSKEETTTTTDLLGLWLRAHLSLRCHPPEGLQWETGPSMPPRSHTSAQCCQPAKPTPEPPSFRLPHTWDGETLI